MSEYQSTERHPFMSLFQLILLVVGGSVLFTCISLVVGYGMYGREGMQAFRASVGGDGSGYIGFLKIVQMVSTIGTFIIPAFIFAKLQSRSALSYLCLDRKTSPVLVFLSVAVMFTSIPFLEWTTELNKAMHLPGFLKDVEWWMREKEDQLSALTRQLLKMTSASDLVINLLMIGVLPGIGEELIFRGCFQKLFSRWFNNYHLGIWLAAIIFSAIHVQFYGFIPRMLLGALFGYMYVWGRSLWLPIIAHFVNNSAIVVMAYQYQLHGKSLDALEESGSSDWMSSLLSIIGTGALLLVFYSYYKKQPLKSDV